MTGKLIVSITLPQRVGYTYRSFKVSSFAIIGMTGAIEFLHSLQPSQIARRPQNDHAYVSAGFLFRVDPANNYRVLEKPRIVYSGIRPDFVSLLSAFKETMQCGFGKYSSGLGDVRYMLRKRKPSWKEWSWVLYSHCRRQRELWLLKSIPSLFLQKPRLSIERSLLNLFSTR